MYIKKILWAIALIGLLVMGIMAYYVYSVMFMPNTRFDENQVDLFIPSHANYSEVRELLKPLLEDIEKFDALANRKHYSNNIKGGKYRLKNGMTNNDIIAVLRSQNMPVMVSFNNQNSLKQLASRVSLQIEADSTALLTAMTDTIVLAQHGFSPETALAMYLPNSYEFFWNTSAEKFVERMHNEYLKFWTQEKQQKADSIGLTKEEVMTLASIVYEESKIKEEQPRVAGVYINRLNIGMPLQADPTLKFAAYQLPKYQNTVIRRVLNEHKTINSPYNTYKYAGLPPGPIAMPDLSAINAVLNYENHNYLYFAADPERMGYHKFATSLSQHNRNAAEYQRFLSSQGIRR